MEDFEVSKIGTHTEVRLARALGRVIHEELQRGNRLPDEVVRAYNELYRHWQMQIEEGHP